jgi:hypothetical protein
MCFVSEALSSNPSTAKKKRQRGQRKERKEKRERKAEGKIHE